jgi:hypothetical protein
MEHIENILSELFSTVNFKVRLKDANIIANIVVEHFRVRPEKHSGDLLLYIKPNFEAQSLKDRKAIEKEVERYINRNLDIEIAQVIVPYAEFWSLTEDRNPDDYSTELYDFILHKLYKKIFRIKGLGHTIRFKVHPYEVRKNTLFVDVRDFDCNDKDLNYKNFKKFIESEVLKVVYHLGIRKVSLIMEKAPNVLTEASDPSALVYHKEFNNYLTPVGVLNFTLVDTDNDFGILKYKVKDVHCENEDSETFKVTDAIQPYIEMIVKDDVKRYGFRDATFQGQANTTIK